MCILVTSTLILVIYGKCMQSLWNTVANVQAYKLHHLKVKNYQMSIAWHYIFQCVKSWYFKLMKRVRITLLKEISLAICEI